MGKLTRLKHITEQPFVVATGAAALIHSTWSLGTLFSGVQPVAALDIHFIGWLVPALLMAFALDIGQISTSSEIREHGVNWSRGITFVGFAAATYYFQWFYMLHHMPELPLSAGVTGKAWSDFAMWLRDAGIWIAPAMLPLSTILYTFSSKRVVAEKSEVAETVTPLPLVPVTEVNVPPIVEQTIVHKNGKRPVKNVEKNSPRGGSDIVVTDAESPIE